MGGHLAARLVCLPLLGAGLLLPGKEFSEKRSGQFYHFLHIFFVMGACTYAELKVVVNAAFNHYLDLYLCDCGAVVCSHTPPNRAPG